MKKVFKLSEKDTKKMYQMIEMGIPDSEIAKKLNINWQYVQLRSTRYWNDKMNKKK